MRYLHIQIHLNWLGRTHKRRNKCGYCKLSTFEGAGGQSSPRDFWPGNFYWPTGKREAEKIGKMEQKRRKIGKKERWKIENGKRKEGGKVKNEERTFLFVWVYQNGNFLLGKKIRKNDFAPSEKYSSYTPRYSAATACTVAAMTVATEYPWRYPNLH